MSELRKKEEVKESPFKHKRSFLPFIHAISPREVDTITTE